MRYLDYFQLKTKFEDREIKPFKCVFKDGVNVIVGENGSGKSTLLQLMMNKDMRPKGSVKLVNPKQQVNIRSLDTEKQNPRAIRDLNEMPKHVGYVLSSRFVSHGQTMFPLVKAVDEHKDCIIFVDEPESGISLSNQVKLFRAFKRAEKNGCQLVIATHSYPIIKKAKEVFSLDEGKWMLSVDYLKGKC